MSVIDRNSPVPLYFQLKQIFLSNIETGVWPSGSLIPGELDIAQDYGLSRTTVRQTFKELVSEGQLLRQRGRGTFVAARPEGPASNTRGGHLRETILGEEVSPGWRLISSEWDSEPPKMALSQLGSFGEGRLYRVCRLRLDGLEPIGYHVSWLPETIAQRVNKDLLGQSAREYLLELPEMPNAHVSRTIEAVLSEPADVPLLKIAVGMPLLQVHRVVMVHQQPVEYLLARYLGHRFNYQVTGTLQSG